MAQAFDLPVISKKMGAPSFAFFAKGGSRKCRRKLLIHCRVVTNQVAMQHRRHPCKKRKDGAPSVGMAYTTIMKAGPPARWRSCAGSRRLLCSNVPTGTLCTYKMFRLNVPVGTLERFYRNAVEISENSENHLKAIVGGRQVAGRDGFSARAEKVVEKTQGEEKAPKSGARSWQSAARSADYIDLRAMRS